MGTGIVSKQPKLFSPFYLDFTRYMYIESSLQKRPPCHVPLLFSAREGLRTESELNSCVDLVPYALELRYNNQT